MIKINYLLDRIRDVKMTDYLSVFPMSIALLLRPLLKRKYLGAWLICDEPAEARENGYYFYRYMCEKQPQQKCIYAIKKRASDYNRIKELDGVSVEFGSIQHWIAYFLCEYNISSQKGGKPNAAMCAFMEMNGLFKTKNIFLQHGIIINNVRWLYADRSKIFRFITSTTEETEYIEKYFGYPEGTVVCTGLPRFDGLHDFSVNKNQIVVMPTWRYWFKLKSKQSNETDNDFYKSEYLEKWNEFLNSPDLKRLTDQGISVIFYLHRNLQCYSGCFKTANNNVHIATWDDYDVQTLLKESELLVTDYSSVFFDMVYMKKPVVFYQFDEEKYRKYQYGQGYFDYHNNPFGKSCRLSNEVMAEIERLSNCDYSISDEYRKAHNRLFKNYDDRNCERVYKMLVHS